MDNIIFLDIDGVLNCENAFKAKLCPYVQWGDKDKHEYHMSFYPPAKKLLNKLIKETNARIVISSTWRLSGIERMRKIWQVEEMQGEIIDITPSMYWKPNINIPRGMEIDYWLKQKGFRHINWSDKEQLKYMQKSNIQNYIIIDDDSDMLYNQKDNFIHVKPSPRNKDGFNETHYYKSLDTLNKTLLTI